MKKIASILTSATLLASLATFGADVKELINKEAGVQNIKYENGVISTMVVVGKAAVPKALRHNPGRAAQYAGGKAQDDAQLQLVRFLSTKCKWGKTASGESAVKEEAVSATDAAGNETSAESSSFTETEMTKEEKAQAAQACISALQVLAGGLDDSGRYTWVGAWNAKAAASIKNMAKTMNEAHAEVDDMAKAAKAIKEAEDARELDAIKNPAPAPQEAATQEAATQEAAPAQKKKDIDILKGVKKPKSSVASDADDFL